MDQFLSNIPHFVKESGTILPVADNDHNTAFVKLNFKSPKVKSYSRLMWDYKKADWASLNREIKQNDWTDTLDGNDIDSICLRFTEKLINLA